jgi:predicted NUDIX family NTP pyrophosphohydrolase
MYRRKRQSPEFLLVHPGGPFWAKKDDGAWSIPKGLFDDSENPLTAAKREFEEETGTSPDGQFIELGEFKQPSGKIISAWALEADFDVGTFRSNSFSMEWPPKSGKMQEFPEADRAEWFDAIRAMQKITKGQIRIVEALLEALGVKPEAKVAEQPSHDRQGSLF